MNEKLINILLDAQRNLNHEDLKRIREIENYFHFENFSDEDAIKLGECIKKAGESFDRGLFVKIINTQNNETLFKDYGKGTTDRNEIFANMKGRMVKLSKHNSFYPLIMYAIGFEDIDYFKDETALPAAGAFPIFVNKELKYIIETSGLHDGGDFYAIVSGMGSFLNKKMPEYSGWII